MPATSSSWSGGRHWPGFLGGFNDRPAQGMIGANFRYRRPAQDIFLGRALSATTSARRGLPSVRVPVLSTARAAFGGCSDFLSSIGRECRNAALLGQPADTIEVTSLPAHVPWPRRLSDV